MTKELTKSSENNRRFACHFFDLKVGL